MLVELPTVNEFNDNIVAFWAPTAPVEAHSGSNTSTACVSAIQRSRAAHSGEVVRTFVGRDIVSADKKTDSRRLIADFHGGRLDRVLCR